MLWPGKPILCDYTNSDFVDNVDTRKSTLGYLITFVGRVVSWNSRLQNTCCSIYYRSLAYELLGMKRFLGELGCAKEKHVLYLNSQSVNSPWQEFYISWSI